MEANVYLIFEVLDDGSLTLMRATLRRWKAEKFQRDQLNPGDFVIQRWKLT